MELKTLAESEFFPYPCGFTLPFDLALQTEMLKAQVVAHRETGKEMLFSSPLMCDADQPTGGEMISPKLPLPQATLSLPLLHEKVFWTPLQLQCPYNWRGRENP